MAELLFIATTVFVAYVVFEVVSGKKEKPQTDQPEDKPIATPKPTVSVEKAAMPQEAAKPVTKAAAKPKKTPAKKADTKPAAPKTSEGLKNPKTGEVAKFPNNYAFAKRWIKEALVEEGLLDRVYKNNELDADVTDKIRDALQKLKAMDKYQ